MLRRLERDALRADLVAVETLLGERDAESDPVGYFQFSKRKSSLESALLALDAVPDTMGAVALLFSGLPVVGSRGIKATFGSRAVEGFQALVTNQMAAEIGPVAARGPVRQSDRSTLMVSDVARGSFGFILEEAGAPEMLETPVNQAIHEVLDIISHAASADEEDVDQMTSAVEERVLSSLTAFFRLIDDAGAVIRFVSDKKEFSLDRVAIERARQRTEGMEIEEVLEDHIGRLYLEPISRRFGMHSEEIGPISGSIHPDYLGRVIGDQMQLPLGFSDSERGATIRHRIVKIRNRSDKHSFVLIGSREFETRRDKALRGEGT